MRRAGAVTALAVAFGVTALAAAFGAVALLVVARLVVAWGGAPTEALGRPRRRDDRRRVAVARRAAPKVARDKTHLIRPLPPFAPEDLIMGLRSASPQKLRRPPENGQRPVGTQGLPLVVGLRVRQLIPQAQRHKPLSVEVLKEEAPPAQAPEMAPRPEGVGPPLIPPHARP